MLFFWRSDVLISFKFELKIKNKKKKSLKQIRILECKN
jgi:hypothetical protein